MTGIWIVTGCLIVVVAGLVILLVEKSRKVDVLQKKQKQYHDIVNQSLETFAHAIDAKDQNTNGHSQRVAIYSAEIAKRMGMSDEEQEQIYYMGMLHDIGKIGIPDAILKKPGKLTEEKMQIIRNHPTIGGEILKDFTAIQGISDGARYHHERYDGNGYPDGLKGEEIPIAAQVVSIVDAYDALTSKRVYKEAYSHEEALKMIQKGKCGVFNPLLIECLMDIESYIQNDLKINEFYEDNEYFEERTQEHLKDEGLNLSNLLYQDLYFEKSKYKFYSELSNNIQFEYSVVPPLLTLSKKDALLLNIEPKIIDPLSNEKVTKLFINNDFNVFIQQAIDLEKEKS